MRVEPIRDKELLARMKRYLLETNKRNHLMFLVGIHTGFRISDILTLQVKHVKGWKIRLFEQKTKKYREVKMTTELKKYMREFIVDRPDEDYLFESRKGFNQPIGSKWAYKIMKELAGDFGLEQIGTHTLRKTYGYQHYRKFNDIATLMKELNHTNPKVTLIYIGVEQEESDKRQSKIDW